MQRMHQRIWFIHPSHPLDRLAFGLTQAASVENQSRFFGSRHINVIELK